MKVLSPMTDTTRRSIVVLLPSGFSIRNVVHSGVLEALVQGDIDVHLFLQHCPPSVKWSECPGFFLASSCSPLSPPTGHQIKGRPFLNGVIHKAFSQRYNIKSYGLYRNWFQRNFTTVERLRSTVIEGLGTLAQHGPFLSVLSAFSEYLYRRGYELTAIKTKLRQLEPDLVWSTMCVSPLEYPYVLAAQDLGIPVVTSILSFDNLTSRSLLPNYDHYLVWNERMRRQLLRLYPKVSSDQVSVTGTPQFDFHLKPAWTWSRSKTCAWLGIAPNTRYFLYAASHDSLAPAEPALVTQLSRLMEQDQVLKEYQLVVRLHPHDDGSRWRNVPNQSKLITLSRVCGSASKTDGWQMPKQDDQSFLISSLAHSEACLNIVSTMALDAASLDRPVIGIDFAGERSSPRDIMYEEYATDHYAPLVESGGLRLALDWTQLMSLMRAAIVSPQQDRERRLAMVNAECGPIDGHASERIAGTVAALIRRGVVARDGLTESPRRVVSDSNLVTRINSISH
jgi:hypothetical protein